MSLEPKVKRLIILRIFIIVVLIHTLTANSARAARRVIRVIRDLLEEREVAGHPGRVNHRTIAEAAFQSARQNPSLETP